MSKRGGYKRADYSHMRGKRARSVPTKQRLNELRERLYHLTAHNQRCRRGKV